MFSILMAGGRKVSVERVRDMTAAGLTPREIALALGVTSQRVYQILSELGIEPARAKKREAS